MSIIGYFISLVTQEDIGASIVEVYDRVTEDGAFRRQLQTSAEDRETEGAP